LLQPPPRPTPFEEGRHVRSGGSIDPTPNEGRKAPPWWSYLWDCCVGVYSTFRTIPTVESNGVGFFFPAGTDLAVKLLNKKGESSQAQEFRAQRPPSSDHRFWLRAIRSLTVLVHKLLHPPWKYITDPHMPDIWFTSKDCSEILYRLLDTRGHEVCQREMLRR
jgi:hypothetical protein